MLLFTPEICESVDDDTEDEIQHNDDDDEVEKEIVDNSEVEQRFL